MILNFGVWERTENNSAGVRPGRLSTATGLAHIGRSDLMVVSLCYEKIPISLVAYLRWLSYLRRDQGRETAAGDVAHLGQTGQC